MHFFVTALFLLSVSAFANGVPIFYSVPTILPSASGMYGISGSVSLTEYLKSNQPKNCKSDTVIEIILGLSKMHYAPYAACDGKYLRTVAEGFRLETEDGWSLPVEKNSQIFFDVDGGVFIYGNYPEYTKITVPTYFNKGTGPTPIPLKSIPLEIELKGTFLAFVKQGSIQFFGGVDQTGEGGSQGYPLSVRLLKDHPLITMEQSYFRFPTTKYRSGDIRIDGDYIDSSRLAYEAGILPAGTVLDGITVENFSFLIQGFFLDLGWDLGSLLKSQAAEIITPTDISIKNFSVFAHRIFGRIPKIEIDQFKLRSATRRSQFFVNAGSVDWRGYLARCPDDVSDYPQFPSSVKCRD